MNLFSQIAMVTGHNPMVGLEGIPFSTDTFKTILHMQGLSIPFACVGSGDPVRVLRLYTTNTLDIFLKHLLLRHMYNLRLLVLMCYAQALRSETSYCYCYCCMCAHKCVNVSEPSHCTVRCFIYCLCRR